MIAKLKSFFNKLNREEWGAFALATYQKRRRPFLAVAWLIAAFELFMIISTLVRPSSSPLDCSSPRFTFLILYIILLALTMACIIALLTRKAYFEKRPTAFLNISVVYAFCICFWGSYVAALSHRTAADVSVFLYVCICVAVLILMKPWQAFLLYGSSWAFFMIMMRQYLGPGLDPFSSQLNSAFASVLCICISIVMYRSQADDFINSKTIMQQNEWINEMNTRLSEMVTVDELTQMHNRRFMEREFPHLLERARHKYQEVALMMMDIDRFKQYNDRYKHQAGDHCLRYVARIINEAVAGEKSHLVRYGGEEFLLLLLDMEPEDVRALAEKIRSDVQSADIPHFDSPEGRVTISIGVCCSRKDGSATISQLIRYADSVLYDAKAAGRNKVFVYKYTGVGE